MTSRSQQSRLNSAWTASPSQQRIVKTSKHAQVALERYHHAVVAALAPAAVARQQQLIVPHDAVDALVVDPQTTLRFELAIEQRGNSATSITRSLGDNRADHRQQPFV